jgi:hypothetical protein
VAKRTKTKQKTDGVFKKNATLKDVFDRKLLQNKTVFQCVKDDLKVHLHWQTFLQKSHSKLPATATVVVLIYIPWVMPHK